MRINPVMPQIVQPQCNKLSASNLAHTNKVNVSDLNHINNNVVQITFRGNSKNINQILSYSAENKSLGNPYNKGGLAVVAQEAPDNWRIHEKKDVRDFVPYHSYDNNEGGIKIAQISGQNGKHSLAQEKFFKAYAHEPLEAAGKRLGLNPNELTFAIQFEPNSKGESEYLALEDTNIKGSFKRMSEDSLTKLKNINYRLFKLSASESSKNTKYFIHTDGLAKYSHAYGSNAEKAYAASSNMDIDYADNCRALVEIMPKLNVEQHGNYNPASWWLHCRPAFMVLPAMIDKSAAGNNYYNGLKTHSTLHNPGRDYQGWNYMPFDLLKMTTSEQDIEKLKSHPQIRVIEFIKENWDKFNHEEKTAAKKVLDEVINPFVEHFIDDLDTYNMTMTPISAANLNPDNMTLGTVSITYGKEMKNPDTSEIALGLTDKLKNTKTLDIVNGSTTSNLKLDDPQADFGKEGNGLNKAKSGFTTYSYNPRNDNINVILKAKRQNTKWLLDIIGSVANTSQDELNKIFFNEQQIQKGSEVIGSLNKYNEGDILIMGWGRPDTQKGFPSSLKGFLEFLKDDTVPDEIKKKTKLLCGAGIWDNNDEYNRIKNLIEEIENFDDGKYKGQACFVNGFFPNRLVGCATYSIFTSRYEPCGITPLESFASGTPCITNKTGGAADIVTSARGYLTNNAFLLSVAKIKYNPVQFKTLDEARIQSNSLEVKECIRQAVLDYNFGDSKSYASMVKDAITQKTDWHENDEYNNGVSANKRYMNEVFKTDKGTDNRNKEPMKRLVNEFGIASEETLLAFSNAIKT